MNKLSSELRSYLVTSLPVFFLCWAFTLPVTAAPLTGESLYSSVQKYTSFGEHRTGSTADHQTSEWLASELEGLGFNVDRQQFKLRQFLPETTQLNINSRVIPAFPHWFPKVVEQPIVAPLAEFSREPKGNQAVKGRIAYMAPGQAGEWHELDVSAMAVQAAVQGAVALPDRAYQLAGGLHHRYITANREAIYPAVERQSGQVLRKPELFT